MPRRPVRFHRIPRSRSQEVPEAVLRDLSTLREQAARTEQPRPRIAPRAGTYVGVDGSLYNVAGQRVSWFAPPYNY